MLTDVPVVLPGDDTAAVCVVLRLDFCTKSLFSAPQPRFYAAGPFLCDSPGARAGCSPLGGLVPEGLIPSQVYLQHTYGMLQMQTAVMGCCTKPTENKEILVGQASCSAKTCLEIDYNRVQSRSDVWCARELKFTSAANTSLLLVSTK